MRLGLLLKKIDEWLDKPVIITCDEVTTAQLPQVIEHMHHTTGVESVVCNTRIGNMQSDSNQSVQSRYHSYAGSPTVPGASGTTVLNKIPGTPHFVDME